MFCYDKKTNSKRQKSNISMCIKLQHEELTGQLYQHIDNFHYYPIVIIKHL